MAAKESLAKFGYEVVFSTSSEIVYFNEKTGNYLTFSFTTKETIFSKEITSLKFGFLKALRQQWVELGLWEK